MCLRELKLLSDDSLVGWDGVGSGREVQEEGDICIAMVDSCRCMAETNTILKSNHPSIKNKYFVLMNGKVKKKKKRKPFGIR